MTFSDKRFRVLAWLAVSEVPHVPPPPRTPFCHRPIRSMYPSTTSTRPSLRRTGSAWYRPYRRELFRYISDSGELRYFGTASPTPPPRRARPRGVRPRAGLPPFPPAAAKPPPRPSRRASQEDPGTCPPRGGEGHKDPLSAANGRPHPRTGPRPP